MIYVTITINILGLKYKFEYNFVELCVECWYMCHLSFDTQQAHQHTMCVYIYKSYYENKLNIILSVQI